jgi:hypothetical protein
MLNKELKTEWVSRLRSGKYKQGKNMLCQIGEDGNEYFCCLGVLADILYSPESWTVCCIGQKTAGYKLMKGFSEDRNTRETVGNER